MLKGAEALAEIRMADLTKIAGKRLLITGGAGFIGARIARSAQIYGAETHLFLRSTTNLDRVADIAGALHFHRADPCAKDELETFLEALRPDVIIHLAASGSSSGNRDCAALFRDNVLFTHNLLLAAQRLDGCRFIHTASSLEPGFRTSPIREDDPPAPVTAYAATKAASTLLVQNEVRAGRRSIAILRPFSVYGPGEPPSRLIPSAIRAGLSGTCLPLTSPGYVRDFVYVDDVADAYLAAAVTDNIDGMLLNIATGRASSNEAAVRAVGNHLGKEITVQTGAFPPRPTDTMHWVADVSLAAKTLGWTACHTLDEGIGKTVAWFRDHESA